MENIIIVNFSVESEAYQALTELKANAITNNYVVLIAILILWLYLITGTFICGG